MRGPNFRYFQAVFVLGMALGVGAAVLFFVHSLIRRSAGAEAAVMAVIVVSVVYLGLAGSLIKAALTSDRLEGETDDRLVRLDGLLWGNQKVLLALVLAGVVFPVFVMIFVTVLNMVLVLLALPFGGLPQAVGEVTGTINLTVAVVFSLGACRYLWKNAGGFENR